ncbi:T9SS type A sorting domain-containing protein [Chryseobacterium sp. Mn2064]|uniref:T9SS type A sorting domain-containing protein n=1 Tax=Chryseobacterium sp. Mn2064 TaxID=3395263 RepID=UPI003BE70DD6
MKKLFYAAMMNLLFGFSLSNAQTVTVSDLGVGHSAVYTFDYTISGAIGTGTTTTNVFYFSVPSGFPAVVAVPGSNNLDPYVTFKVNGVSYPCSTSFKLGGSWVGGVQLSIDGASTGVSIPAGAKIQVVISGLIKNPSNAGAYTLSWKTAQPSGQAVQNFSTPVTFSSGTLGTQETKGKQKELSVYPNPATDFIQVSGVEKTQKYIIYTAVGNQVNEGNISENGKIDVHYLVSGVYVMKLENGRSVKFIKK